MAMWRPHMKATVKKKIMTSPGTSAEGSRSIGAILVGEGRLSPSDVDQIERFSREQGMRFGDAAIQLQLLSKEDVDFAIARQFNYPILTCGGQNGVGEEVIAGYRPESHSVEPLRALRSQLLFRWPRDATTKVIAVTSAERGDGRSWLAANLATVFAQIGERTLLMDADMRHPRQHELFNLNNDVGLSALITGRATREIARRIHPQLRLFVLASGRLPPNPQELLSGPVFDVVLEQFTEQFDVIVIDTPAMTETADAQILASRAGTALIVARRNHTRQKQLVASMNNLTEAGVNVIGSVIQEL
jgi:protein-tyrosine kinase